jgi:Flp pilus assembly protein CpaB
MATLRDRLTTIRLALRRTLLLRRRLLAALLAGVAVFAGLRAAAPPAPPSVWVVTAAHDLDGGAVLATGDLTRVAYADGTAPDGSTTLDAALGRTLAAPLRRGEPVTDVRLVGPGLLSGYSGSLDPSGDVVALPVRVPDAGVVALLRVGDLVDLLATDPSGGGTTTVATDVPVLAIPQPDASAQGFGATGTLSGRLIVVATTRKDAEIIENAAVQCFLSVAL